MFGEKMQVSKISPDFNITFGRKLTPDEQRDYEQNALKPALDYLGTEEVAMIIHGTSYPQQEFDLGVGSPYGEEALKLIKFEKLHGFNSNQLGPVGVIRDASHISPYKSTVFTKNYLFTDLNELTKDEYANILSEETIDSVFNKTQPNGENYAYSDFPEAFANYQYCIKIANKNFKQKLAQNNPDALRLNEEFQAFKKQKGADVYKDALFEILVETYETMDFNKWSDIDRNLIKGLEEKNPQSIDRYKKITMRSKDDFESYIFGQFIIDKQIKENTRARQDLNFKYINDLLVGFSLSDEWANQDLFLKDYRMGCPYGGANGPQTWDIPVLDPQKLFTPDGELGKAGKYLKRKLYYALENFDNLRIDHALGLIDPYIYDRNSVEVADGRINLSKFRGNNISNLPQIDPQGNYRKILDKIVLPTLAEHGIDKNYPVWEDLGTDTSVFNKIYHEENNLPGISQLEWTRGEQVMNKPNWGLVGSHDSDPALQMIKKEWVRKSGAWNPMYLAGFLNSNPKYASYRDEFCEQISENDNDRVKAKFAELFLTCKKVQISFADFFGINKTYNKGGEENDTNWKLRLNKDWENDYYKNLSSDNPTAINMPEILKMAVRAKSDLNAVKSEKSPDLEYNDNSGKIISNLQKYENILKED